MPSTNKTQSHKSNSDAPVSTLLEKYNLKFCSGGKLRQTSKARRARPLHMNKPIHLVLKCNRQLLLRASLGTPQIFSLCQRIIKKYANRFRVGIEMNCIQGDHIHFIIRIGRRSDHHSFLRVVAGQIAQQAQNSGLAFTSIAPEKNPNIPSWKRQHKSLRFWKWRPFTRLTLGHEALLTLRNYVRLNELEARGQIAYRKERLRGLSQKQLRDLWSGS